jgi:hypothetical protein
MYKQMLEDYLKIFYKQLNWKCIYMSEICSAVNKYPIQPNETRETTMQDFAYHAVLCSITTKDGRVKEERLIKKTSRKLHTLLLISYKALHNTDMRKAISTRNVILRS